jgi:hypothetical protein
MTSTCKGDSGFSFGWINYSLIESAKKLEHFNPLGGEERIWIGPEGGQFSVFFSPGSDFTLDNWYVPEALDTEPFEILSRDKTSVSFRHEFSLKNFSSTEFSLAVTRKVSLLTIAEIEEFLAVSTKGISCVGYESGNTVRNTGSSAWEAENGLLSIWMLGMLIPSPQTTVVIPVKAGSPDELGPPVNDDYFGRIEESRLKVKDNTVFFRADGEKRSKIGIPPLRATRVMGSYDPENGILSLLECILPGDESKFVNSAWEIQENPYGGDALNSYNDGPLPDGSRMGPFYELESSSPALDLLPGENYTHIQRTYHFMGDKEKLDRIAKHILKTSIAEIENAF